MPWEVIIPLLAIAGTAFVAGHAHANAQIISKLRKILKRTGSLIEEAKRISDNFKDESIPKGDIAREGEKLLRTMHHVEARQEMMDEIMQEVWPTKRNLTGGRR